MLAAGCKRPRDDSSLLDFFSESRADSRVALSNLSSDYSNNSENSINSYFDIPDSEADFLKQMPAEGYGGISYSGSSGLERLLAAESQEAKKHQPSQTHTAAPLNMSSTFESNSHKSPMRVAPPLLQVPQEKVDSAKSRLPTPPHDEVIIEYVTPIAGALERSNSGFPFAQPDLSDNSDSELDARILGDDAGQ